MDDFVADVFLLLQLQLALAAGFSTLIVFDNNLFRGLVAETVAVF